MDATNFGGKPSVRRPRINVPERTKADVIVVATAEFSGNGLSGARVDAIAEKPRTAKRMIDADFGNREGLYLAVLKQAYAEIRNLSTYVARSVGHCCRSGPHSRKRPGRPSATGAIALLDHDLLSNYVTDGQPRRAGAKPAPGSSSTGSISSCKVTE